MNYCIYDIETLKACFLVILHDVDSGKRACFKFTEHQNDVSKMIKFWHNLIERDYLFVGFNNIRFDAQVIEYILKNEKTSCEDIYLEAQRIIECEEYREFIPEWKLSFRNVDLYLIQHYDNKNKRTSLKWLEYTMRMKNIEEIPIDIHKENLSLQEIKLIESYCHNDIDATLSLFNLLTEEIHLRHLLSAQFEKNFINFNNGKLGMKLLSSIVSDKLGISTREIENSEGIYYNKIALKDLIYPYIKFKTLEFNNVLEKFKNTIWSDNEEKNSKDKGLFTLDYKQSIKYSKKKNYGYVYGYGGLHQCIQPGVYESNDYWIIIDADVASLYPSLPLSYIGYLQSLHGDNWIKEYNNMKVKPIICPEHLPIETIIAYKENIVDVRLAEKAKPKKEQSKTIIDGYKQSANIPYGKSGEITSWFYNKKYNLTTTINGQLLISMLSEALYEIPECIMLQNNTDGITIKIPRKHIDLYYEICKDFQKKSNLILEFAEYSKMVINNVNNYLAVYTNGKVKRKGDMFEIYEDFAASKSYHKNPSFLVITEALNAYFVHNKPISEFVRNHKNIYDFCAGIKKKSNFDFISYDYIDGKIIEKTHQKVTRFFISNKGVYLSKEYNDGRDSRINAGNKIIILNKIIEEDASKYDINYNYYIEEVMKVIRLIEKPKTLFL